MDDHSISIEELLIMLRDPLLVAGVNAYIKRRIERAEQQAEFIRNNPDLFRRLGDKQG